MKEKKKEHINKIIKYLIMKYIKTLNIFLFLIVISLSFTQCKTQDVEDKVPFTITEKTYFYWVGGKKGTNGTNIEIVGTYKSMNVSFSKIYFQNHEYAIATELNNNGFILKGNFSEFRKKDINMHLTGVKEYGNEAPKNEKKIPFDLHENEAIIEYSINGKVFYHKLNTVKQLETVNYP